MEDRRRPWHPSHLSRRAVIDKLTHPVYMYHIKYTYCFFFFFFTHPKYYARICAKLHHGHGWRLSNHQAIIRTLQELVPERLQRPYIQYGHPKSHHSHRRSTLLPPFDPRLAKSTNGAPEPRHWSRHLPAHPHNRAKYFAPKIICNHSLRTRPWIPVKSCHP